MYATRNKKLIGVYSKFDDCKYCRARGNKLQHILGVGDTISPKLALILINPTHLNISSNPDWKLYRFPFIGVRHFWKVLNRAGLVSQKLLDWIYTNNWDRRVLERINDELAGKRVYLTNLVKCCQDNPSYPSNELIGNQQRLLIEELNILKPKNIICFGLLPLKVLTGQSVNLKQSAKDLMSSGLVSGFAPILPLGFRDKVYPCYFPVGRGNPRMAERMLSTYRKLLTKAPGASTG